MREVAIIGAGVTKFGELWNRSFRDIGIEAGLRAIQDAGLTGKEIDSMYIGNMSAGRFVNQQNISALIADYSGLASNNISCTSVEAGEASGGVAFKQGVMAVASGFHDIVIVAGAEKMTDIDDSTVNSIFDDTGDEEWESSMGMTFASLFAMIARRAMHEGIVTREEMASVSVNSHAHGALNPNAQFRKAISLDTVLKSGKVADPLGLFDCAPISDGAAAVVLCPMELAKKYTDSYVKVSSVVQASDTLALAHRDSITSFGATVSAGKKAFEIAGIKPSDVSVAEISDNYTISGILAMQDLGFYKKGKAGKAFLDGELTYGNDGPLTVNTSGGLKARGHPAGATGVAQIVEITDQLRGRAEGRQVKKAKYGLAQSVGGTGSSVTVSILEAI